METAVKKYSQRLLPAFTSESLKHITIYDYDPINNSSLIILQKIKIEKSMLQNLKRYWGLEFCYIS
jgi:hypothetical protein